MNAVLQCLSHTDILAEYFVLDQYKVRFFSGILTALHTISILNCDKRHKHKLQNEFDSNSIYMQKWNGAQSSENSEF